MRCIVRIHGVPLDTISMFVEIRINPHYAKGQAQEVIFCHRVLQAQYVMRRTRKGMVMGKERLHHPTPDDVTLDRVLGALSDPIRRDVLARIADHGPQFCGDFDYGIAKSTMSYHFKVLRESGLMHTEVLGTHRKITRRDSVIENLFPGLLDSVGLPPGQGQWDESAANTTDT
mgnify:FL=1